MSRVGRPTILDDEQTLVKIRQAYLDGASEASIAQSLDIPIDTWNNWKWKDYKGFNTKLMTWRHERMLMKAEANLEATLGSEDERLRHDATKFVSETLGKKSYSKQLLQDHTTGGEKITFTIPKEIAEKNDITPSETEGDSEGQS